ncbi:MAG TPA: hypothetical protein VJG90_05210 [Candidatus Nanoarchaeia archaeon]|nr:hypothetical protein [Candidatus Nanoarchaeia archaeon]
MAEILFKETFEAYVKNLAGSTLVPHGKPKKHVLSARDLKGEIGKQTILKDYDGTIDVVHVLGTLNQFSGLGNVVVIESQGYKINPQTAGLSEQPLPE